MDLISCRRLWDVLVWSLALHRLQKVQIHQEYHNRGRAISSQAAFTLTIIVCIWTITLFFLLVPKCREPLLPLSDFSTFSSLIIFSQESLKCNAHNAKASLYALH